MHTIWWLSMYKTYTVIRQSTAEQTTQHFFFFFTLSVVANIARLCATFHSSSVSLVSHILPYICLISLLLRRWCGRSQRRSVDFSFAHFSEWEAFNHLQACDLRRCTAVSACVSMAVWIWSTHTHIHIYQHTLNHTHFVQLLPFHFVLIFSFFVTTFALSLFLPSKCNSYFQLSSFIVVTGICFLCLASFIV